MRAPPERIGPYQIVRHLGAGGMGTVFVARHPQLEREVALKLLDGRRASERALARFWREAELLARARHPGVVAIHDLGRAPEGPYLVEELVEGELLSDLAERGLRPRQAARLVRDLADALEAVHALGILHRDLKPANVMVRRDGKPVLLDFGLARDVSAEQLTRTGELLGTPAYMAPEQANPSRAAPTPALDVYGLGAILYDLLCGEPPIAAESLPSAVYQLLHEDPRWPSQRGVLIAPALEAALRRALHKDPQQRQPSAAALRDELDRYLASDDPAPGWRARRWLPGALALLVAGALGAWRLGSAPPPDAPPEVAPSPAANPAANPAASPAASSAASATPPRPAGPTLWDVPQPRPIALRTWYDETDHLSVVRLGLWCAGQVEPADGDVLRFQLRIEATRVEFGVLVEGLAPPPTTYDSRAPDPHSRLSALQAGVGQHFEFLLDRRSGHVAYTQGIAAAGSAIVARARRTEAAPPQSFADVVKRAFSDAYLEHFLVGLLHVLPPGRDLAWGEAPVRNGVRRFAIAAPARARVIPTLSRAYPYGRSHRYRIEGEVTQEAGHVGRARLQQVLVGALQKGAKGDELRRLPNLRSEVVWELEWLPPDGDWRRAPPGD
ncbi:MAG: protein kinase [Planctomycetota bacterium]